MELFYPKEIANVNYCGYCSSIISVCNCSYFISETIKRDHLEREIDKYKKRLFNLREELNKL